MEKILIDKSSIKKNPNAGQRQLTLPVGQDIYWSYSGPDIPLELQREHTGIFISSEDITEMTYSCEGFLDHEELVRLLPKDAKISISVRYTKANFLHPEPKYSYNYDINQLVTCHECGGKVEFKEIQRVEDYSGLEESYREYDECPICEYENTFNYEYQKIEDII